MKKIYLVIIILAIAAIGAGAYFMRAPKKVTNPPSQINQASSTQTTVDTSSWETYRDEKLGYEVKYPKNTLVNSSSDGVTLCFDNYSYLSEELINEKRVILGKNCFLLININGQRESNPNDLSVKNWLIQNETSVVKGRVGDSREGDLFLGESTYHTSDRLANNQQGFFEAIAFTTYLFHGGILWRITDVQLPANPTPEWKVHPYYKYFEQSVLITNAIIGSFRFTK